MANKRKQRVRTQHPGVKLKKRIRTGGLVQWLARWKDPATGKDCEVSLAPLDLTNEDTREAWAVTKSKELARDRATLAAGGTPLRGVDTSLEAAIKDYLTTGTNRLRPRTLEGYTRDLAAFAAFCAGIGVARLDRLTLPHLVRFREAVAGNPRTAPVKGGARFQRKAGARKRAAPTCNRVLRAAATFLLHARRLGLTPKLDRDAITDGLKRLREPRPRPEFLRAPELTALLAAALRHDTETYKLTRMEKDGLKLAGTTARYEPAAPLVLAALLTGCRVGELLTLRWEHVFLTPPDKGELIVTATASKTARERAVDLEVSPSLVRLLAALKLRAGDAPYVFGGKEPLQRTTPDASKKRLIQEFGAPLFTWQGLRQTCASFLVNAPGIYGGGAPYREAMRLGHGVMVAERNYVGLVKDIPKEAATLEAAMGLSDLAERVIRAANGTPEGAAQEAARASAGA